MAFSRVVLVKAEQYLWRRLGERIAGPQIKIKRQIILTDKLATNNLAELKQMLKYLLNSKLFLDLLDAY